MSLKIGRAGAEGLLYQNEGNDTKNNSIKQLELWGYDKEKFETSYDAESMTLEASDDKVSFGYYEKLDTACVVDYAANILKSSRIVVHGQSMGAATVALYDSVKAG